jgi:type IV pilus assembly protein PilA
VTAIDKKTLEAKIGPKADYYLRRFEQIDAGRRAGWNWAAFFFSTAWFSYRGLGGWCALNFFAPWLGMLLLAFMASVSDYLGVLVVVAYLVVFFVLVPVYADALYYRRIKRTLAHVAGGGKPSSPTWPISATVVALISILLPAVVMTSFKASQAYVPRAQVSEAISLMGSARTPVAEYFADKGKWPDNLKLVAENTSGRNTERVEITAGAGATSGALVMTATMKASGVNSAVAGKTVQYRSEDGGKTWICRRGAVNGVEDKYLPAACR